MTKQLYTGVAVAAMVFVAGVVLTGFALNAWTVVSGIFAICAGFLAWIYVRGDVERTDRSGEFRLSKEQRKTVKRLDAKRKFQAAIPPEQRKMNLAPRFSENFGPIEGDDGEWYFPKIDSRPADPSPPASKE